jgi:hypothetical protein
MMKKEDLIKAARTFRDALGEVQDGSIIGLWLATAEALEAATIPEAQAESIKDRDKWAAKASEEAKRADGWMERALVAESVIAAVQRALGPRGSAPPVEHRLRQTVPWPASSDATFMYSSWTCTCGWVGTRFRDVRGEDGPQKARIQAEAHLNDPTRSER